MSITIEFDMEELSTALSDRSAAIVVLDQGLILMANAIRDAWVMLAQRVGVRNTGGYIAGLRADGAVRVVQPPRLTGGIIDAVIEVEATAPHSQIVEDGHAAFHMPSKVDWTGPRVKVSKSGVRYLHIPFRHTANVSDAEMEAKGYTTASRKSMMPAQIYDMASKLARTMPQKVGPIRGKDGAFKQADRYAWGERLTNVSRANWLSSPQGNVENRRGERTVARKMVNPEWGSSKFEGMFKSGGQGHSQYMTIRTMTENSPGWHIPAQHGHGLARKIALATPRIITPTLEALLSGALVKTP